MQHDNLLNVLMDSAANYLRPTKGESSEEGKEALFTSISIFQRKILSDLISHWGAGGVDSLPPVCNNKT